MSRLYERRNQGTEFQEYVGDNALIAYLRLGGSYSKIVKRILYWINRTPDSFTKEDWENLGYEISALESYQYIPGPEETVALAQSYIGDNVLNEFSCRIPYQAAAQRFLNMASGFVSRLVEVPFAVVGPLSLTLYVRRKTAHSGLFPKSEKVSLNFPNLIDQAIYQLVRALQECEGLVVKCPECSQIFLADRINQKYCSPRCLSRVTTRRSRTSQKKVKRAVQDQRWAKKRVVKRSSKEKK